jgi:DNA-binding CsgD family transcriptional regulator
MKSLIEPADEQEFNRLLAEGDVRLRRSREALKTNPRRPADWEEITPTQLKPAVEHVRKQFDSGEWHLRMRIECGCYLALHPDLIMEPKFKGGFDNLIPVDKRPEWRKFYAPASESQIFKFWSDQFGEGLAELIVAPFNSLLKIGLAQKPVLSLEPVEWAKTLARNLLYSLEWTLPHKIKEMCDEQKQRTDFAHEHFLAYCAWVYWRAPRFIHMQPSGNTPYDPETAWEREDEDLTERLLHGLTERIIDSAWFKLNNLAGEAFISLASVPLQVAPAQPASQSSHSRAATDRNALELPKVGKDRNALLPKKTDLSNYFDQAKLTDRQRDCASFKHEYGLTVTEIAERLGVSRKTVDEHLTAAERRIQSSHAKDRAKAHRKKPKDDE